MSGLFRRRGKEKRDSSANEADEDPFLDMITMKVNDADGNYFGEVVSADTDAVIIKHDGKFYSFKTESVRNKFGDLMIDTNVNLNDALRAGEAWKDPGKAVIGENKFYDFSEERKREEERNEHILRELEKARDLTVESHPPNHDGHDDGEDDNSDEAEGEDSGNEEDLRSVSAEEVEGDDAGGGEDQDDHGNGAADEDETTIHGDNILEDDPDEDEKYQETSGSP